MMWNAMSDKTFELCAENKWRMLTKCWQNMQVVAASVYTPLFLPFFYLVKSF